MGTCRIGHWGITGSRRDAYAAEIADELHDGKQVVRMWRAAEGTDGFGAMCQRFRPDAYFGRRARFSASMRTVGVTGRAALCFRVDGPDTSRSGRSLAFDNMQRRALIQGTTPWSRYASVLDVPPEATAIFISNMLAGAGELFWADLAFEIVDASVPVTDMLLAYALNAQPMNLDFTETA